MFGRPVWLTKVIPTLNIKFFKNETILVVGNKDIIPVLNFLKYSMLTQFSCLTQISGVDYPERKNRFEVSYELLSVNFNSRVRVKTFVNEVTPLASAMEVFRGADWWEREIWDLYGVYFENHGDLRRLLTDYGFQGHALRKDFPLSGRSEVLYDEKLKRVVSQPLELTQDFRYFEYKGTWSQFNHNKDGLYIGDK